MKKKKMENLGMQWGVGEYLVLPTIGTNLINLMELLHLQKFHQINQAGPIATKAPSE